MEQVIENSKLESQFETEDNALLKSLSAPLVFDQKSKSKYECLVDDTAKKFPVIVITNDDYLVASDEIARFKGKKKTRSNYWGDLKDAANRIHKDVCLREKKQIFPYDVLIQARETAVNNYLLEQKHILDEKQRLADEEARRKEAEAQAQILVEAEKAAMAGNIQDAEDFADQVQDVKVEPVHIAPTTPKTIRTVNGTSSWNEDINVTHWDVMAVIGGVMAGELPLECVEISDTKLKTYFKSKGITKYNENGVIVETTFKNTSR